MSAGKSTLPVPEQVTRALSEATEPVVRPSPEEVMGALDLNAKVEAYLTVAVTAWMQADHHDKAHQRSYEGCHHIELEWWDETGVSVSYYPKWVNDANYAEHAFVPMLDLLPDFALAYECLVALQR